MKDYTRSKTTDLMSRIQCWADEHNGKVDWGDIDIKKYYIVYDNITNTLMIDWYYAIRPYGTICFLSKTIAEEAIKVFGDEIIKDILER